MSEDVILGFQEDISVGGDIPNQFSKWSPIVGEEATALLSNLTISTDSKKTLISEAIQILSRCTPPNKITKEAVKQTGIVIGYVQSGKTMSFTTVAALARDNKFQLIIVITGTSTPLFTQSRDRLIRDLRLTTRQDRAWRPLHNPDAKPNILGSITATFSDWNDINSSEEDKQTVLITVMKNTVRLKNLIRLLSKLNLVNVATLIIDDEADQASLNTQIKQGEESTTYRLLLMIRDHLPHHTFLQYTATPQAPLLINIIDALSPDFAELLSTGKDYVGGKDFFTEGSLFVETIPSDDINQTTTPPDSLLKAMKLFIVGVVAGKISGGLGNRSMMVHPSQRTEKHNTYYMWVNSIRKRWQRILEESADSEDRKELIFEFEESYKDIQKTVPDIAPFSEITQKLLREIRNILIVEVNSTMGRPPLIEWNLDYAHILVGGQAMDRGFTVEGLTVTYMPRNIGVGNADTIQQRARFFGYKRSYLGYCRVYLERESRYVYQQYVQHEEDIRQQLLDFRGKGKPLSEWKRAFFLTNELKPTRDNVLDLKYLKGNWSDDWCWPKAPHYSKSSIIENKVIINDFISKVEFHEEDYPLRTDAQQHLVTTLNLKFVYENLLTSYKLAYAPDSQKFIGLLLQLKKYIDSNLKENCTVYYMSPKVKRPRTLNFNVIPTLHQGSNSLNGQIIYPGDSEIKAAKGLTVQIYSLNLVLNPEQNLQGLDDSTDLDKSDLLDVPVLAIWVPSEMSKGWLVQEDGK